MNRFWEFQNKVYNNDKKQIELLIEGDIIDYNDTWLHEWLNIPYTGKNKFKAELEKYDDQDITVTIDSNGGSVWAATGIYDALKKHTGKVTVKITRAASSATIPAMAGDEILISIAGLFMIHNPFPSNGVQGDANKLREVANMLDTVKEIIINAYMTKTNLSKEEIWLLMDNDTLMSSNMAIEKGFVDGLIADEDSNYKINNIALSLNRLAIVNNANESIEKAINKLSDNNIITKEIKNQNKEGELEVEIKNIEDLKNAFPNYIKEIEDAAKNNGAIKERERIKSIDEIADNIDQDLVNKAKFEKPIDAKDLAFEAMKKDKNKGQEYLNNLVLDNDSSGVNDVKPSPIEQKENFNDQTKKYNTANNIADIINKKRRIK